MPTAVRAMSVENNVQTKLGASINKIIQNLKYVQSLKIRVGSVVDRVGIGVHHVITPWNTKTIKSKVLYDGKDLLHILGPKPMYNIGAGLKTEPARTLESNRCSSRSEDLVSTGFPTSSRRNDDTRLGSGTPDVPGSTCTSI